MPKESSTTREAWALIESGTVANGYDANLIVPWWSFTKTVLAAAALVLVRDSRVRLDDRIAGKPYTLRQLLQHRAGLTNYGGLAAYHEAVERGDEPWSTQTLWDKLDADRLRYEPGQGWDYSNVGYWMVAQLIQDKCDEELDVALRHLVLDPLGIVTARIASEKAHLSGVEMGKATAYHPGWVYHSLLVGAVQDAALLLHRLVSGHLLSQNLLETMLEPFVLPGPVAGRPWQVPGYGLGIMRGETLKGPVAGHTGGGPGSTIAVYHALSGMRATAVAFKTLEDAGPAEEKAMALVYG